LKEGEENKSKVYCALCHTPGREVTPEILQILNTAPMPIVLHQKTPIRVLHRRNLDVRLRKILSMSAKPAMKSKEMFILSVKTEAGTYVKEFVHSDLGRTVPSVADLIGVQTEILSLDVDAVELDWPPVIDD
jgi:tRNA pseudouridine synthase 10